MENLKTNENLEIVAQQLLQDRDAVINDFFGVGGVDERHNFSISTPLEVTNEQVEQLEGIGGLFSSYVNGISRIAALSTIDDKERRVNKDFRQVRKLLGLESHFGSIINDVQRNPARKDLLRDEGGEREALALDVAKDHPLGRFDVVLDPVSGKMQVVEIEVGKFHGLGYSTFCRGHSESLIGTGVANLLCEMSRERPVLLILANSERFYEVESSFLQKVVNCQGGNLVVIAERQLSISDDAICQIGLDQNPLILGIPKLSGHSGSKLEQLVGSGKIEVVSKSNSVLGEKAAMALITNATADPFIENLLVAVFGQSDLRKLREIIPFTQIPQSRDEVEDIIRSIEDGDRLFVKVVDSSGARGVADPSQREKQIELLRQNGRKSKVIVQRAVDPHFVRLPFADLRYSFSGVDNFSLRFGLFTFGDSILDLAITASPGVVAHGSKKSIQTGVKVVGKLLDNEL